MSIFRSRKGSTDANGTATGGGNAVPTVCYYTTGARLSREPTRRLGDVTHKASCEQSDTEVDGEKFQFCKSVMYLKIRQMQTGWSICTQPACQCHFEYMPMPARKVLLAIPTILTWPVTGPNGQPAGMINAGVRSGKDPYR